MPNWPETRPVGPRVTPERKPRRTLLTRPAPLRGPITRPPCTPYPLTPFTESLTDLRRCRRYLRRAHPAHPQRDHWAWTAAGLVAASGARRLALAVELRHRRLRSRPAVPALLSGRRHGRWRRQADRGRRLPRRSAGSTATAGRDRHRRRTERPFVGAGASAHRRDDDQCGSPSRLPR